MEQGRDDGVLVFFHQVGESLDKECLLGKGGGWRIGGWRMEDEEEEEEHIGRV